MFACALFALGLIASYAAALPATAGITRANLGSWCDGAGKGAVGDYKDFKLYAFNTTGINTNSTGVPLVFGSAGALSSARFRPLSTFATFHEDHYPTVSLVEGRLYPSGPNRNPTAGLQVTDGQEVTFVESPGVRADQYPQQYCAVAQTSSHSQSHWNLLAINGEAHAFSLCRTRDDRYNVIFKAQKGQRRYNYETCYPVQVQLVPKSAQL